MSLVSIQFQSNLLQNDQKLLTGCCIKMGKILKDEKH